MKKALPPAVESKDRNATTTTKGCLNIIAQPDKKERGLNMSANELTSKVRELKELKAMAEELAAEITSIEDAIKAEMTAQGTDEMVVDVFKIRWTRVTSNRFDTTAFKKTHADLYAQYTKQTESRRFSIA